ncbi:glycosyl transferase group 1 [Pedosphaera parvula Ellin514]|uniref:Glycosyl transferase group 1 n=2 Tax=Pedosphaera TaxID=1032526 RepID=B9XPY3_PEDPL|nr:glycosyl transferase group 1 [Pedosphaera parvula Ellin514]
MYCGNCFRDNALVAALRKKGHSVLMIPLYLPMTLDEEDQTEGTRIFFNGINVYLEQKSAFFREAPNWLHNLTGSPALLKLAAGSAAKTRAADVGDLTLSMMRGEEGNQAREIEQLIAFLKTQPRPDIICLSNVMLIGMVRRLKQELGIPVACVLQGEDTFLDALPDSHRNLTWRTLAERAREIDLFIPPTRYFGNLMKERLGLPADRVRVISNGINIEGFAQSPISLPNAPAPNPPVLGYFARMCKEKGLDVLVEAFIILKERNRVKNLKLKVGGGCGPSDQPFVNTLRERLRAKVFLNDVEFHPNVTREEKLSFFSSLSVFSVPALYGEAFGLYVIEALASGVPVVQPNHAAFPELVELSGGGLICEPRSPKALADSLEQLLLNPDQARALGAAGRKSVQERFTAEQMAVETLLAFQDVTSREKAQPHA